MLFSCSTVYFTVNNNQNKEDFMRKIVWIFGILMVALLMTSCFSLGGFGSEVTSETITNRRHVATYSGLGAAINTKNNEEVKLFLESGVSPNEKQEGITPLAVAIQANNVEAVMMILNHEDFGDINEYYTVSLGGSVAHTQSCTAIVDAIELGNPEIIKAVLDKGAVVDYVYETIAHGDTVTMDSQSTPLLTAMATFGSYDFSKQQSDTVFDIQEQYVQIQRIADKTQNVNRILVRHEMPDVGPGNIPYDVDYNYISSPQSLFMILNQYSKYEIGNPNNDLINEIFFSLIDRGVNLSYNYPTVSEDLINTMKSVGVDAASIQAVQDSRDYTYAYNSWILNNAPLLEYVLNHGGSVSVKDDGGVHFLTQIHDADTLQVMLDRGLDINAPTYNGYRLIYNAVGCGTDFLEAVLQNGADPNLESNGLTAIDFAGGLPSSEKRAVTKLLEAYGAK